MNNELIHRGIVYSVIQMPDLQWRWEIDPPLSVKGLHLESGVVDGSEHDARQAAKRAIDQQTRWLWAGAGSPAPAPLGAERA